MFFCWAKATRSLKVRECVFKPLWDSFCDLSYLIFRSSMNSIHLTTTLCNVLSFMFLKKNVSRLSSRQAHSLFYLLSTWGSPIASSMGLLAWQRPCLSHEPMPSNLGWESFSPSLAFHSWYNGIQWMYQAGLVALLPSGYFWSERPYSKVNFWIHIMHAKVLIDNLFHQWWSVPIISNNQPCSPTILTKKRLVVTKQFLLDHLEKLFGNRLTFL